MKTEFIDNILPFREKSIHRGLTGREITLVDSAVGDGFHTQLTPVGLGFFNKTCMIGEAAGVAKIPKHIVGVGYPTPAHLREEVSILDQHDIATPVTTVAETPDGKTGIILAQYIENVSPITTGELLKDESLREQLRLLLEKNDQMIKSCGCSIDLMGFDTALNYAKKFQMSLKDFVRNNHYIPNFPLSSNVINDKGKLTLIDSGLLWLRPHPSVKAQYILPHLVSYATTTAGVFNGVREYITG